MHTPSWERGATISQEWYTHTASDMIEGYCDMETPHVSREPLENG